MFFNWSRRFHSGSRNEVEKKTENDTIFYNRALWQVMIDPKDRRIRKTTTKAGNTVKRLRPMPERDERLLDDKFRAFDAQPGTSPSSNPRSRKHRWWTAGNALASPPKPHVPDPHPAKNGPDGIVAST